MTSATYITLICLAFVGAATAGSGWSYTDVTSWSKDNPNCAKKSQSPIDIKIDSVEDVDFEPFVFTKYNKYSSANLTNNGHTVQLDVKGLILSGGNLTENYETLQLHFHWSANNAMKGSEHAVDSKYYPLEVS
ncbi:carbonic anhydrase 12 [Octopus bimaculoides]|nr:carbonic anhydrase 12 [Octopus bimaculoides]